MTKPETQYVMVKRDLLARVLENFPENPLNPALRELAVLAAAPVAPSTAPETPAEGMVERATRLVKLPALAIYKPEDSAFWSMCIDRLAAEFTAIQRETLEAAAVHVHGLCGVHGRHTRFRNQCEEAIREMKP